MHIKMLTAPLILGLFTFTGCGGGGSSSSEPTSITGQFLDSAVQGLSYICSSGGSGTTNANGEFTCNAGDTVTFSVNGFEIGSAQAGTVITPKTLYPNDSAKATDVAQLLQTLDSDGNPNNGITIDMQSQAYQALAGAQVALGQVDFDSAMTSYIGVALVDEATANAHMELTIQNVENGAGAVNSNSLVVVMNNVAESVCQSQDPYTQSYEGYTDFADFLSAGGSVSLDYFNGSKSCSEYSVAAFCQEQDFANVPGGVSGTGSCVEVVTFPTGTTGQSSSDGGSSSSDSSTQTNGDLEWLASSTEKTSPRDAIATCEEQGARLPTADEFFQAFKDGVAGFDVDATDTWNVFITADTYTDNMLRYKTVVYQAGLDYSNETSVTYGDGAGEWQGNAGYVRCVKDGGNATTSSSSTSSSEDASSSTSYQGDYLTRAELNALENTPLAPILLSYPNGLPNSYINKQMLESAWMQIFDLFPEENRLSDTLYSIRANGANTQQATTNEATNNTLDRYSKALNYDLLNEIASERAMNVTFTQGDMAQLGFIYSSTYIHTDNSGTKYTYYTYDVHFLLNESAYLKVQAFWDAQ